MVYWRTPITRVELVYGTGWVTGLWKITQLPTSNNPIFCCGASLRRAAANLFDHARQLVSRHTRIFHLSPHGMVPEIPLSFHEILVG
jgi:hypothetical protein